MAIPSDELWAVHFDELDEMLRESRSIYETPAAFQAPRQKGPTTWRELDGDHTVLAARALYERPARNAGKTLAAPIVATAGKPFDQAGTALDLACDFSTAEMIVKSYEFPASGGVPVLRDTGRFKRLSGPLRASFGGPVGSAADAEMLRGRDSRAALDTPSTPMDLHRKAVEVLDNLTPKTVQHLLWYAANYGYRLEAGVISMAHDLAAAWGWPEGPR